MKLHCCLSIIIIVMVTLWTDIQISLFVVMSFTTNQIRPSTSFIQRQLQHQYPTFRKGKRHYHLNFISQLYTKSTIKTTINNNQLIYRYPLQSSSSLLFYHKIGNNDDVTTTRRFSSTTESNDSTATTNSDTTKIEQRTIPKSEEKHVKTVLFVECGFGSDAHGQNSTKAAVRACRNAIEFNQIPCIGDIIPGGRTNMKLDVLLGVPTKYQYDLNFESIRQCFPYGNVRIQLPTEGGGLIASNGKVITEMGDTNDDMIIVCVAVTVGY